MTDFPDNPDATVKLILPVPEPAPAPKAEAEAETRDDGVLTVAIIGSGPAGLSAAARAAELGLPHVLLEAEDHASDTIFKYQKGKHVMAEPAILPLRSGMSFEAGRREEVLDTWNAELAAQGIAIRYGCRVSRLARSGRRLFEIGCDNGETFRARHVVLAIGLQGNVRKLVVKTEDGHVFLTLPLTAGAFAGGILTLGAPWLAILAAVAGLVANVKIEVTRDVAPPAEAFTHTDSPAPVPPTDAQH